MRRIYYTHGEKSQQRYFRLMNPSCSERERERVYKADLRSCLLYMVLNMYRRHADQFDIPTRC